MNKKHFQFKFHVPNLLINGHKCIGDRSSEDKSILWEAAIGCHFYRTGEFCVTNLSDFLYTSLGIYIYYCLLIVTIIATPIQLFYILATYEMYEFIRLSNPV